MSVIRRDGEIRGLGKEQLDVAVKTGSWRRLGLDVWGQWRGSAEEWMERKRSDGDFGGGECEVGLEPVDKLGFSGIGVDLDDWVRCGID